MGALLTVLTASFIGSIMILNLYQGIQSTGYAERGVSSNRDLTNISNMMDLILNTEASCSKSGLIGLTIDPIKPLDTKVEIYIPGNLGKSPYLAEGVAVESTRSVQTFRFVSLEPISASEYLATLLLETTVNGRAITSRSPNKTFVFYLTLDGSSKIIQCSKVKPSTQDTSGTNLLLEKFDSPRTQIISDLSSPRYISCKRTDAAAYCSQRGMIFVSKTCVDVGANLIAGINYVNNTWTQDDHDIALKGTPTYIGDPDATSNRAAESITCATIATEAWD